MFFNIILQGPLIQFDIFEYNSVCCYNICSWSFLTNEYQTHIILAIILTLLWQIYEYLNYKNFFKRNIINFDEETIVADLISKKNYNYVSIVATFFLIIFFSNISGLLPLTHTLTSQLIFTLVLSIITIFIVWAHAFYDNKINILNHFLPNGSPLIIIPFIILIELISNVSRIISLAVRLFANITSGHALLKILASFVIIILNISFFLRVFYIFPYSIVVIITLLEILIAFLQTYVWCTLFLIYISEQE